MARHRESAWVSPKAEPRPRPQKGGYGVFAREPIGAGEVVTVWGGEVVTGADWRLLSEREKRHSLQVEDGFYLAPTREPEAGDYVNHSCEPNCGLRGQIVLVAMRDIEPGEEICFDYSMADGSDYDEFVCQCGSDYCRALVTGDDWARPDLQARYAGYFSPYLQARIDALAAERSSMGAA